MLNSQVDQAGAAFKPADAGKHGEPGILHHFFGLGTAADDSGGNTDQGVVEPPDQRAERGMIAGAQAREEGRIVEFAVAHGWPAAFPYNERSRLAIMIGGLAPC